MEVKLRSRARGVSLAAVVGLWTIPLGAPALTIPTGTDIPVTIDQNIALKRGQIGKSFAAHVTRDVVVNRAVAIPAPSGPQPSAVCRNCGSKNNTPYIAA